MMLVFFSGRRLKPGSWEQFRRAWEPQEGEMPEGVIAIYHARNVKDEDEVISFGIFDTDRDGISAVRGDEQAELKRQDAMAAFTKNVPLEGIYEVIEEIRP
jgi:heme-degrading monooxygenase HmoA